MVSGGIFTIPLMKKAGYGGVKAGAIETMSSVNGQIMPPVMGAAAFLMVEYVGITYTEICKHAFLPATLSYISLFYIVHLEALKLGLEPFAPGRVRGARERADRLGAGPVGHDRRALRDLLHRRGGEEPARRGGALDPRLPARGALRRVPPHRRRKCPDLPQDIDVKNPVLPETWPTVKAGLHFLIPIGMLIWCLMIEELSPALSAFWATVTLLVLMVTQRPLTDVLPRPGASPRGSSRTALREVVEGMNDGARNMIGIAIATGTAGIIVGGITLTGLGFRMTEFVEFVSMGNVIVMLLFTAFVCLVLGLGVPTTANYILVATLMAPVIVELGAQSGLVIPLIAVHLFVFYYGIMGDITPPVGLASFAAAAISGEDPIKTGIQGSVYALRTVVLPFVWIFNPQLLLIDVHGWWELMLVVTSRHRGLPHLRRGDDGLVPDEEPLVGDGRAAPRGLHALPPQLLHGPALRAVGGEAREAALRDREGTAGGLPPGPRHRGHQRRGRRRPQDRLGAARQAGRGQGAPRRRWASPSPCWATRCASPRSSSAAAPSAAASSRAGRSREVQVRTERAFRALGVHPGLRAHRVRLLPAAPAHGQRSARRGVR